MEENTKIIRVSNDTIDILNEYGDSGHHTWDDCIQIMQKIIKTQWKEIEQQKKIFKYKNKKRMPK